MITIRTKMPRNVVPLVTVTIFLIGVGCLLWFSYSGYKLQWSILKEDDISSSKAYEIFMKEEKGCGQICSYDAGDVSEGKYYPFIKKKVECRNIIARMVKPPGKVYIPPLKQPPKELYQEFIQFGKAPITRDYYLNDVTPPKKGPDEKDDKIIDQLREKDRKGQSIGYYKDCHLMKKAMVQHKDAIEGKRGLVVGTILPWLEAMIFNVGAKRITTSEYAELTFVYPNIDTTTPYKLGEEVLKDKVEKYDFVASFSSIEHSGLGRYGDPINPYGDFEAVAQVWCLLKPGGYFFLGLPTSNGYEKSYIEFNAHRVYGNERLQHLTANFEVVDRIEAFQSVFVLKKII